MNAHVHPVFSGVLSAMSGDALRAATLYPYIVRAWRNSRLIAQFEAMAPSSCECVMQHMDAYPDCKIEAIGMDEWRERAREARAMREEQRMNDAMRWANGGRG